MGACLEAQAEAAQQHHDQRDGLEHRVERDGDEQEAEVAAAL